jgi:hypothetical protein
VQLSFQNSYNYTLLFYLVCNFYLKVILQRQIHMLKGIHCL